MKVMKWVMLGAMLAAAMEPCAGMADEIKRLTRDECVEMALENNRLYKISQYDIQIAEAMLKQAKSAYWPTLSAGGIAGIMDEPLVFTTPAGSIDVSALVPAPPGSVFLPVPEHKIDMMDEEVLMASLNLKYPLYAGGKIKAINEQARFGVEAARQGVRRSELEVVRDVDRAYYGSVMARKLVGIADDTLQRMEATLDLTKRLYEEGSGTVKKTDYLRNKTTVEVVRSAKSRATAMKTQAATALVNLIGLDHGAVVEPTETDLPKIEPIPNLPELIQVALGANPDLGRVRAGIGAATAKLREARSGYKPTVGVVANYTHIENDLDTGMMDPQNKDFAAIGIAVEMPLFHGFRTKAKVREAKLQLEKLKMQEDALTEGIALQVEHAYAEYESALEREGSTGEGLKAASENRDLNVRAYQEELVETADVIQAQITEALLDANYQKTLYECIEARAKLSFLVGSEIGTPASAGQ